MAGASLESGKTVASVKIVWSFSNPFAYNFTQSLASDTLFQLGLERYRASQVSPTHSF